MPPHILRVLLEHNDSRLRQIAMRSMTASIRLRERRNILRQMVVTPANGGQNRTIFDVQNGWRLPGKMVQTETGPTCHDPAVKEAFAGLGATYRLFYDEFHRDSLDGKGMPLKASVHYGEDYDNAFWDGRQMVFGDGDQIIFAGFTKAIDVIGHELAHGVIASTCDLEYHNQSGALNESFADVFGSLVKQYPNENCNKADWLIGEGLFMPGINAKGLRSMAEPGSAYDDPKLGRDPQPDHMNKYVKLPDTEDGDWGGVHINSGIPNHAFYLLAKKLGGCAWEKAGHIWYEAMAKRLWPEAQFQDCADVTFEVAGTIYGTASREQDAVAEAWDEVGIAVSAAMAPMPNHHPDKVSRPENGMEEMKKHLEAAIRDLQKAVRSIGSMV